MMSYPFQSNRPLYAYMPSFNHIHSWLEYLVWECAVGVTNMDSKTNPDLTLVYTDTIEIRVAARCAKHRVLVLVLP